MKEGFEKYRCHCKPLPPSKNQDEFKAKLVGTGGRSVCSRVGEWVEEEKLASTFELGCVKR